MPDESTISIVGETLTAGLAYYQQMHRLEDEALAHRLRMPVENLMLPRQSPVPVIERLRYARELHPIGRAVSCNPLKLSALIREWRVCSAQMT